MKWKLTHRQNCEVIENEGGKTLSYNPNLGIQIIEKDGYAFKDLNLTGVLEPFEDWRLPLTIRVKDFMNRFTLWQEEDHLYYRKGRIDIPQEIYETMNDFRSQKGLVENIDPTLEDITFLKDHYLLVLLLLMFDNDGERGREDYLLQLILQSMDLGLLENIMYSIWEAIKKYMHTHHAYTSKQLECPVIVGE